MLMPGRTSLGLIIYMSLIRNSVMEEKEFLKQIELLIKKSMPGVSTDNLSMDTRIIEDLRFDSLGLFVLVTNIERHFNIKFDVYVDIVFISDLFNYINQRLK